VEPLRAARAMPAVMRAAMNPRNGAVAGRNGRRAEARLTCAEPSRETMWACSTWVSRWRSDIIAACADA